MYWIELSLNCILFGIIRSWNFFDLSMAMFWHIASTFSTLFYLWWLYTWIISMSIWKDFWREIVLQDKNGKHESDGSDGNFFFFDISLNSNWGIIILMRRTGIKILLKQNYHKIFKLLTRYKKMFNQKRFIYCIDPGLVHIFYWYWLREKGKEKSNSLI